MWLGLGGETNEYGDGTQLLLGLNRGGDANDKPWHKQAAMDGPSYFSLVSPLVLRPSHSFWFVSLVSQLLKPSGTLLCPCQAVAMMQTRIYDWALVQVETPMGGTKGQP